MNLDELRKRSLASAARVVNEVKRRLNPPREFERPPARLKMAPVRADGRAVGWRAPYPQPPEALGGPALIALYHATSAEDWLAVAGARPQFDGHAQPRLPADGFSDPTSIEVLTRHAALATAHGIFAFGFVIAGGAPSALEAFLAHPKLTLSFCVALPAGDAAARERLLVALSDPRRHRVDDRSIVIVDGGDEATADALRREVRARGMGELMLLRRGGAASGFDGAIVEPALGPSVTSRQAPLDPGFAGEVRAPSPMPASGIWPLVRAGGDDEPCRPGRGRVTLDSPRGYRDRLRAAREAQTPAVFLDAWNDWTRGAVLEPDARLGAAWLCATRDAVARPAPVARPCVVVHAYHVELLEEIVVALRKSQLDARVIVTVPFDREAAVRARLAELGLVADVEGHENRGRDILPFLRVANRLLDEGCELVLKLHTKRSGHRDDGEHWRAELIGRLLEPTRVGPIRAAFAADRCLGVVAPEGHLLPLRIYWGWNEETVLSLCARMGVAEPDVENSRFAAGSMYWLRLAALRPLLDLHLGEWEFPAEGGFVDGTMAHGIERALGLAASGAGFASRTAAEVCGLPYEDAPFAYALPTAPEER